MLLCLKQIRLPLLRFGFLESHILHAIYEIQENQTLAEVILFALGTTAFADNNNISVKRLLPSGEKIILKPKDSSFILKNGDKITVNASDGQTIQSITLTGAVRNAGISNCPS